MSGKKYGSPNENYISRPISPQNRSQAIRYQRSSEQELEEQRIGEDSLDSRHSGSDATNIAIPFAGTEEASEQPPRLPTNEDPTSDEPGTTQDAAPEQAGHGLSRTAAAGISPRSLDRPPLSIDTGTVTAESNLVCISKHIASRHAYSYKTLCMNEGHRVIYMTAFSRI